MQDYTALLFAGKKLCVMPEKQFRKLNGQYEQLDIELSYSGHTVVVCCHRSVSTNKLYILPDEFEKIPSEIRNRLNIKDIRPDPAVAQTDSKVVAPNAMTFDQLCHQRVSVVSLRDYCNSNVQFNRFTVDSSNGDNIIQIACLITSNGKIGILQTDYENLPVEIQNRLTIVSSIPKKRSTTTNLSTTRLPSTKLPSSKLLRMEINAEAFYSDKFTSERMQDGISKTPQVGKDSQKYSRRTSKQGKIVLIFKNVLDFSKHNTIVVSSQAMKMLCEKNKGYPMRIYIADINKEIVAHFIYEGSRILIQQSDFDSFPLSTKLQFSLLPIGGGCFSVKEVSPANKGQSLTGLSDGKSYTKLKPAIPKQQPSQKNKKLEVWLVSQAVMDYWIQNGQAHQHTIEMKFRHKGNHSFACVRKQNDPMPYISKEEYCRLPPRVQAMLDCHRFDERTLIDRITKPEKSGDIGRKSIVEKDQKRRDCTLESEIKVLNSYFSENFIGNVKRRDENIWNAWLKSKQIFIFEDSFATQILANATAAEEVLGEALIRCPFATSYIIGREEDGATLEFFAVLADDVLRFQKMQNEETIWSCELKIDPLQTGKKMLATIADPSLQESAMKMLQLYSCLCSATLEEAPNAATKSESSSLPSSTVPKRDRSAKNEIPDWDVDVYTVTMRREIKKQRRRVKANDSADSPARKPYPRRAHWHHYWVGSRKDEASRRLVLKWLPEIVVNQKEKDLPVRIILVRNKRTAN